MFTGTPVGLVVDDPNSPAADPLLVRAPGIASGVPIEWTSTTFGPATADHPDYSVHALTDHWAPPPQFNLIPAQFGGISTGGEVTPEVNALGEMEMISTNWYMLSITVDRYAEGEQNSLLNSLAAGSLNAAGDILSYYAIESLGIHPEFIDSVRLEYSREQLQLPYMQPPPPPGLERDIANVDFGVGRFSAAPVYGEDNMFPVNDCFYFTLTKAWVDAALPIPGYHVGGAPPSASTIYVMEWLTFPNLHWSDPTIVFDQGELFAGFQLQAPVEIDALSVDKGDSIVSTSPERVVFSLTPESDLALHGDAFDQVLVYQPYPLCQSMPLKTDGAHSAPELVSDKFGLLHRTANGSPDNVTGTCGRDPNERYLIQPVLGVATDQSPYGAGTFGLSAARITSPDPGGVGWVDTLHLQAAGMSYSPCTLGAIVFYIEGPPGIGGDSDNPPTQLGPPVWIDPGASQRNLIDVYFPIPHQPGNLPTRFSATCFGIKFTPDPEPVELRASWIVSILI
jgi:hypothetical protein